MSAAVSGGSLTSRHRILVMGCTMVTLGPQGDYHVMLSGLKEPLKTGSRVPATLNFANAGAVKVEITVEPIGSRGPSGAMPGMDHH